MLPARGGFKAVHEVTEREVKSEPKWKFAVRSRYSKSVAARANLRWEICSETVIALTVPRWKSFESKLPERTWRVYRASAVSVRCFQGARVS